MRVVILGAGFVGASVATELWRNGFQVHILSRFSNGVPPYLVNQRDLTVESFDFASSLDVPVRNPVKEKFDFIIHCAHEFGSAGANPIAWNTKLIRLAESFGCRHIIYFSSLGVYANFGRESVQEDSLTLSQNDYTNFKLQSEQLILEFDWESSAIIRLGAPIGVGIPKWRLIGKLIRAASSNQTLELYKWGNRLQQYVDVRDIASVLVHVMSKGLDLQIFNLTGSELISNLDLAKKIRNTLKSNSQIVFSDNYDNQDEMRFEASCLALQQTGYNFKFSLADSISWMAANVDSKP